MYRHRALFIAIQTMLTTIGLVLTGFLSAPGWRYTGKIRNKAVVRLKKTNSYPGNTGIFLANAGSAGCIPGILAYVGFDFLQSVLHIDGAKSSNNITSHTKRAVSTAMVVSFGGIGGIFATTVFRQADLPRYLPGIYATIACQVALLLLLATTTTYFYYQNKRIIAGGISPFGGGSDFKLYTL